MTFSLRGSTRLEMQAAREFIVRGQHLTGRSRSRTSVAAKTVVVISGDGKGDRLVESLEVKAARWLGAPRETDYGIVGSAKPLAP
jgi:hypothetical protein